MVGDLQYLTFSHLDTFFAVNQVCQFMHSSCTTLLQVIKHIFCYVKGTLEYGLVFHRSLELFLHGFSDFDWASSIDDRRFTTEACIFLGPKLLTWIAKKQTIVSRSSTETKCRAFAYKVVDLRWFGYLFREIGILVLFTPCICINNVSAIHLATNPMFHARTHHIEIDYHFIWKLVACKSLVTRCVPSSHQLPNLFTRGISRDLVYIPPVQAQSLRCSIKLEGG